MGLNPLLFLFNKIQKIFFIHFIAGFKPDATSFNLGDASPLREIFYFCKL